MDGLIVRLLADKTGSPARWFGKAFSAVLRDLDSLRWHAPWQPWMGAPAHFDEKGELWRRGSLGSYWPRFAEEDMELWGYVADPGRPLRRCDALAILIYTDSTALELYADLPGVAEQAYGFAKDVPDVLAARARFDRRGEAFGFVGLSDTWRRIR